MTSTEQETTIYKLAGEAYDAFEKVSRGFGSEDETTFTRLKDEHRDTWLQEMVYSAHGEFLPDDWRYDCIRAALGWIHDTEPDDPEDPGEFADGYVDVYNAALTAWLASDLRRGAYCDEAAEEFGYDVERGVFGLIALGQYEEASEVYHAVMEKLNERLEEIEDV
jgi:hypothetical protein